MPMRTLLMRTLSMRTCPAVPLRQCHPDLCHPALPDLLAGDHSAVPAGPAQAIAAQILAGAAALERVWCHSGREAHLALVEQLRPGGDGGGFDFDGRFGPCGYSLSRFRVRGGQSLGLFILTAKMLPATLLVIPLFGIFRTTGLIGSMWSIILAHATLIIPFTTWMLKGYFDTIPRRTGTGGHGGWLFALGALVRVILPVSAPAWPRTALYGFVLSWSDYAYAAPS